MSNTILSGPYVIVRKSKFTLFGVFFVLLPDPHFHLHSVEIDVFHLLLFSVQIGESKYNDLLVVTQEKSIPLLLVNFDLSCVVYFY